MAPLGSGRFGFTLAGGTPYEGADVSADLFWHLQKFETAAYSSGEQVTFNVGGTNRDSYMTVYDGNQTFGSGSIGAQASRLTCVRINGDLTVSSGFDLYPSADSYGLYMFVDGNLTVDGTISTYQMGESRTSSAGALVLNSSENEVAGSTGISWDGSAGTHTNGSSTSTAMTAGGGGTGGYGSYGRGNGNEGHTFAGGSGGGGGGGIAYPEHYSGGGGGGGTATSYSRNGGNGGASGHTKWGYWTSDKGGMGGNGNPAGGGGTNNSYNGSSSSAGGSGYSSSVSASMAIYASGNITVASGGAIKTIGRGGVSGGTSQMSSGGGGGTGGGILVAVCAGTFTNNGTVATTGGSVGSGRGSGYNAGNGGVLTGGGYA
jgi:hypothetical protein